MELNGAIALVTGANGDIGQYYVEALQKANVARIYACARKIESLSSIVESDPERIIPVTLDITDTDSIGAAVKKASDVNLLINNAGIGLRKSLISAEDLSGARAEIDVNYLGTLSMCRAFAPVLKANGGGAIINMLSILGRLNFPGNASYSASKAAAISMTQGIRNELAKQGTLVVGVLPGTVDTEGSKDFPQPKVSPEVVVQEALKGVAEEIEDIYPGDQAQEMRQQLKEDPKSLEKAMAEMVA